MVRASDCAIRGRRNRDDIETSLEHVVRGNIYVHVILLSLSPSLKLLYPSYGSITFHIDPTRIFFFSRIFRTSRFSPLSSKKDQLHLDRPWQTNERTRGETTNVERRRTPDVADVFEKCRSDNLARLGLVKPGLWAPIQLTAVVCCLAYSWLNWSRTSSHPPPTPWKRSLYDIYFWCSERSAAPALRTYPADVVKHSKSTGEPARAGGMRNLAASPHLPRVRDLLHSLVPSRPSRVSPFSTFLPRSSYFFFFFLLFFLSLSLAPSRLLCWPG